MIPRALPIAAVALLLGLGIHACSSPTEPSEATSVLTSVAQVSLDALGASSPVTATILDQRGKEMIGLTPVWSSNAPTVATVSATGLITAVGNGSAVVTATLAGISATVNVTVAQVPAAPVAHAGNGQSAVVQTALAQPLQVKLADRLGAPMAGIAVSFSVMSGGGTLSTSSATTGADGLASTRWTLGTVSGTSHAVSATATGNGGVALFTATALPGAPTSFIAAPNVAANGQRVKFGTAAPIRPAIRLQDALGNGIAGESVTFVVTAGGGTVTGGSVLTDASGIATVGAWTMGSALGLNVIEARFGAFAPVAFSATAIEDPCTLAGAYPLTIGDSVGGALTDADCAWTPPTGSESLNDRYDYYRFTLTERRGVIIEMYSPDADAIDPFLYLYNGATNDSLGANDDIDPGTIRDSRIARILDPGTYLIRATGWDRGDRGPYSVKITGCAAGEPATVRLVEGNGQVAAPGSAVAVRPQVSVFDNCGVPVQGASVSFAIVPGFGAISGATATTGTDGIASLGSWTLAAGPNVLSATVAGMAPGVGNPTIFSATGKASTAGFDITLRFVAMPTASQLMTFGVAAQRWEEIITGDLPAQGLNLPAGSCNSPQSLTDIVDDVLIIVRLESIDGQGGVLGSAGPCASRTATNGGLTALGTMRFDTADLANLETAGSFGNVILHEMGHVIGIGTLWSNKGFLVNPSSTTNKVDTHFSGPSAITAFNASGGGTYTLGAKVPVENCQTGVPTSCGSGTINSHWREGVLKNELMTGYLGSGLNPLSAITIASLRDIGYAVDDTKADAYSVPLSLMAGAGLQSLDQGIHLQDDIEKGPIVIVGADGRPVGSTPSASVKKRRGR